MAQVRIEVVGRDREHLADLRRVHSVGVVRQTLRETPDGQWTVQAVTGEDRLPEITTAGYEVTELDRGAPAARAAPGDERGPQGYLTVDEVEARIAKLADANPDLVELIELPNRTWEDRTAHALRIGSGEGGSGRGICFIGGVHAREWGSPDILVELAERLVEAYKSKQGLTFGEHELSADDIAGIVEGGPMYVFPQVNPDGRNHSLTVDSMWRKNRRPAANGGGDEACSGVDINRNFNFLWDFERRFSPQAAVSNSTDPCDYEVYTGPAVASEPESQNVVWLLEQHPDIEFFVDVHSYGEMILYNWGDDVDQVTEPDMNFRNTAYDGKRGLKGDEYMEYLDPADRDRAIALAEGMRDAIEATRGHRYTVQQSMDLYPTAGTTDDYAYSRHVVSAGAPKTLSFTVEWGSDQNQTPFHPPYAEMKHIIEEVSSGLLEFCRLARS